MLVPGTRVSCLDRGGENNTAVAYAMLTSGNGPYDLVIKMLKASS